MSRIETHTGSLAVNPSGYIRVAAYSLSDVANAYDDETSTTYALIRLTRGTSGAVTEVYYTFDTSSIPANATIDSVECKAKVYFNTSKGTKIANRDVQMFSGTTAKGDPQNATTTVGVRTFSGVTWTRSELEDARIRFYGVRGTSNLSSDYYFRFYGATLTVTYEYQETIYTITSSSSAQGITVTPASQECSEGGSATVTISGASDGFAVTDNDTDVTSQIVQSGNDYTYTISSIDADHVVLITPSGPVVFYKQNGAWVKAASIFYKQNGAWVKVSGMFVKENGTWKS